MILGLAWAALVALIIKLKTMLGFGPRRKP